MFLTALAYNRTPVATRVAGSTIYLAKPVDTEELIKCIEQTLSRSITSTRLLSTPMKSPTSSKTTHPCPLAESPRAIHSPSRTRRPSSRRSSARQAHPAGGRRSHRARFPERRARGRRLLCHSRRERRAGAGSRHPVAGRPCVARPEHAGQEWLGHL